MVDDPAVWLFFEEDWPTLGKEDREWFKLFIRMIKERNKGRQNQSDSRQSAARSLEFKSQQSVVTPPPLD